MTSQLSSESSSSCSETDPNKSINDLMELFTYEEDMLLLKQIQEEKQSICGCKVCSMDRLRRLAYQVAREKNKQYPKSWDKKKRAKSKWMKIFEQNYRDKISIFSSDFILLHRASTSEEQLLFNEFLTFEEERSLLEHVKMTQKKNCICQGCIMTEVLAQFILLMFTGMIILPESWNNEAKKKWLKDFKERHKNEISKFPNSCELFKVNKQQLILTVEEEISLLRDAEENITKKDCTCQKCLLRKVSVLAYELVSDKNIPYPESWEKHKKAESRWLKDFKVRYKDFISYFPTICKITSRPSMSRTESSSSMENVSDVSLNSLQEEKNKSNIPIEIGDILLFIKEEKMLKQMKEKQSICGCDYCLKEFLKKAYQEVREELNAYPQSSNMDNKIVEKWFKNFEKRYKDEILMFPFRCKLSFKSERTILSVKEELSLLKDIKKNSKGDCICQKCVLNKIPFLAYKLVSSKKPNVYYPTTWKRNGKAGPYWVKRFKKKHESIISRFPTICKLTSSQSSVSESPSFFSENESLNSLQEEISKGILIEIQDILLFAKEEEILKQMIIDKQSVCSCKCCMMDRLENAYLEACEELKFLQSSNIANKAIEKWFENFEEKYKDKIFKIPNRCELSTQKQQSILTVEEELSLLPDIEQNSNKENCICQECILREVPVSAYKLASDKNIPCPELWKKHNKAGLWWLKDFKAKHEIFISFYPTICKKTSFQPSIREPTSFTENISELLNNLREELNKSNAPIEVEKILLFIKEKEILMKMMENRQSVCGCKSCLMGYLKQEAHEELKRHQQSNMDNEIVEKWFKNFEERYKDEISTFPFRCEESIEKQPILTLEEELSLLKDIQENCTKADCICQECVTREASFLAYKLASNKNIPCPESWKKHKKAGSRWLKGFKVRHNIFFSYFPTICEITSSQPSTSGLSSSFMENVSESFNISQKESKYNIPIEIENILLFIKEEEILKQMMEDKQSVCGCECCLMNRLKKVYQEAREKLYPQFSNMDNEAVEMWFKNFEAKYRNKISKFRNRCELSEKSIKQSIFTFEDELLLLVYIEINNTKEDCICQECLLKEVSLLAYELASNNNILYPESWKQHKKAELQWLKDFAKRHKNKILKFPLFCKIISEETIKEQGSSKLVFDLKQERSLLIDLEANNTTGNCICRKCVLEKLPFLVYKLAYDENLKNKIKQYPKSWNRFKKAGRDWMKDFIKRHEKEFAKLSFSCKINSSEPSTSKGQLSLN